MFIVKFNGGLGNQMYQYAFYEELKNKYPDIQIKADLDRYIYEKYKQHNGFELVTVFDNVHLEIATTKEILLSGGEYERHKDGIIDIIIKFFWNKCLRYIKRNNCVFERGWKDFSNVSEERMKMKDFWICGYWANLGYEKIPDFVFRKDLDKKNKLVLKEIQDSHSVSIHVRRGDYVGIPSLDIIGIDYYKKAVEFLENKYNNLKYFVFSDDKKFISENFSFLNNYYIVTGNTGEDSYKDMQLMSLCRHNIICNSTFSTWAARLNPNPDKCIIAPANYLKTFIPGNMGEWIGI